MSQTQIDLDSLEIGDSLTVTFDEWNNKYLGVAHEQEKTIVASGVFPGETATCEVLRNWSSKLLVEVTEILEADPHRVEPECKHFYQCAGCQFQQIDYQKQIEIKQSRMKGFFQRHAPDLIEKFDQIIPSTDQYGYRNTVKLHGPGEPGFWKIAGYEMMRNEECPVTVPELESELIKHRKNGFLEFARQDIENVMIRAHSTGDIYAGKENPETEPAWLEEILPHPLENRDVTFQVPPTSFWQASTPMLPTLIEQVSSPVEAHQPDILLESFCGVGVFGLMSAPAAKNVIGIENNKEAVKAARQTRDDLGYDHVRFIHGDADEELTDPLSRMPAIGSSMIVDPPRDGLRKSILKKILKHPPEQLIYVSCNPDSLARNLALLCEDQYDIKTITGIDLFPQTKHLESVSVLYRKDT